MYEKIQPLLENLHGNFTETRNNIGEQMWEGWAEERAGAIHVFSWSSPGTGDSWGLATALILAWNFPSQTWVNPLASAHGYS